VLGFLKNGDLEVGKLTIQWFEYDKEHYYLTHFKIAPQFCKMGWGTKMFNEIVNDVRFLDRPILVDPAPFGGDIGSNDYMEELSHLQDMYRNKFSFEDLQKSTFLIRKPK